MRTHQILLPVIVFIIYSCKKGSNDPATNNSIPGELSAKINGQKWIADSVKIAVMMNGTISIAGTSLDAKTIAMNMQDAGATRYILNKQTLNTAIYYNDSTYVQYFTTNPFSPSFTGGGEVNISEIDKTSQTITGTFHYEMLADSMSVERSVTDGVFSRLPYITTLPLAKITDIFYADVDGVAYHPESISVGIVTGRFFIHASDVNNSKSLELHIDRYLPPLRAFANFLIGPDHPDTERFDNGLNWAVYNENSNSSYVDRTNGQVDVLEFDPVQKRLRGNFNFDASSSTGNKTVKITGGYFSVGY